MGQAASSVKHSTVDPVRNAVYKYNTREDLVEVSDVIHTAEELVKCC